MIAIGRLEQGQELLLLMGLAVQEERQRKVGSRFPNCPPRRWRKRSNEVSAALEHMVLLTAKHLGQQIESQTLPSYVIV